MTTIDHDHGLADRAGEAGESRLARPAAFFLLFVGAAAAAATIPFLGRLHSGPHAWSTFVILAGCAALAQLFKVKTPSDQAYYTTAVFLIPAALLLPPELVAPIALIAHLPEWLKVRYPWYIQSFNIANYTVAGMAAWAAGHTVLLAGPVHQSGLKLALAGLAASVVFVFLNHLLLAQMLQYARGHSYGESRLFTFESLSTDLVLAALGVGLAAMWLRAPALVPFALAPLFLIHRSLAVPRLEAEARIEPKTGLFNARHFAAALGDELDRAERFGRPLAVVMADLDLLRAVNNSYGHLAGDVVLRGVADAFRGELRSYDVAARFGGEEFSILLPETTREQALEIAERIRASVAAEAFTVSTASEPIHVTVSLGVASYPEDGRDANELIHQADLAVYRAKVQGRNRVQDARTGSVEPVPDAGAPALALVEGAAGTWTASVPLTPLPAPAPLPAAEELEGGLRHPLTHAVHGPRFVTLSTKLGVLVGIVSATGIGAGVLGLLMGRFHDALGFLAFGALVGIGQALALEVDEGSISVAAVGALAGAAVFGVSAALPLALITAAVEWSARRSAVHQVLFNVGALSLASLAAAGVFEAGETVSKSIAVAAAGLVAGVTYFLVNTSLLTVVLASEGHERPLAVWQERFAWLVPHYVVYGFVGGVMAIAYSAAGLYALAVFAVPLLLMRRTQETYLAHTQRSARKLREAAETIREQNISLERANRLLRERSTAAMESLSATVDARDAYTAGHSRRVRDLAIGIGRELGLSAAELDLLSHAALFHDVGKIAIPDAVLLKRERLSDAEWALMRRHTEEGARIIGRLGFLEDAVPAILHHHENFDGTGYPSGLRGEDIPLGARIIHVADAFDSMMTTRIYRQAIGIDSTLPELFKGAGRQFCPRCIEALERALPELGYRLERRAELHLVRSATAASGA